MNMPMKNKISELRQRPLLHFGLIGLFAALVVILLVMAWMKIAAPGFLPEKLVIAHGSQPAFALIYIADAKGFLRDEGLDVEFQDFTLGRDALASVISGKADIATVYETPTVLQMYQGQPLGILSTLHSSTRSHALLARRDRGISQPADLRGKRIGFTPGTSMDFFLALFLAGEGLPADSVTRVPVEPGAYQQALGDKAVDALVTFNPTMYSLQQKLGKDNLAAFYSNVYVETSMLVGMRDNLLAKPEATKRLLRAAIRAKEFAAQHREESIQIVFKRLAHLYPEAAIRHGWDLFKLEVELDNGLLTLLTQEAQWMRDNGRFKTPVPDFTDAIMTAPLKSVDPSAVTLLGRN